jgi:hypothetical protein
MLRRILARKRPCLEDLTVGSIEIPCLILEPCPKSIECRLVLRIMMEITIEIARSAKS